MPLLPAVLGAISAGALAIAPGVAALDHASLPQNSKDYSITQTVQNNSGEDLTLVGIRVDNGATITAAPRAVSAQTSAVFSATNHGNGVHMWLTFVAADGTTVVVDTDVPKVDGNYSNVDVTNAAISPTISVDKVHMGKGNNPSPSTTLSDCLVGMTCVFRKGA